MIVCKWKGININLLPPTTLLNLDTSIPKTLPMKENEFSNFVLHSISKNKKQNQNKIPKKQSTPNNLWKKTSTVRRHPFGEFCCLFEEFIRPTTATIKYEIRPYAGCSVSSPVLYEHRHTKHDISWHIQTFGSMSIPACASSKMSVSENQILSQASVFCLQTMVSDPIPDTAYLFFLISSCPLSLTIPKQEALTAAAAA